MPWPCHSLPVIRQVCSHPRAGGSFLPRFHHSTFCLNPLTDKALPAESKQPLLTISLHIIGCRTTSATSKGTANHTSLLAICLKTLMSINYLFSWPSSQAFIYLYQIEWKETCVRTWRISRCIRFASGFYVTSRSLSSALCVSLSVRNLSNYRDMPIRYHHRGTTCVTPSVSGIAFCQLSPPSPSWLSLTLPSSQTFSCLAQLEKGRPFLAFSSPSCDHSILLLL